MKLSPECKNESLGLMCGACERCGRVFEWRKGEDGNSYKHITKASPKDDPEAKELAKKEGRL